MLKDLHFVAFDADVAREGGVAQLVAREIPVLKVASSILVSLRFFFYFVTRSIMHDMLFLINSHRSRWVGIFSDERDNACLG